MPAQPPTSPDPVTVPGAVAGAMPGMPGFSWQQSQQVQAEVRAAAGPAVPMSSATVVAAVAGLGGLLMLVGSWAPWLSMQFLGLSHKASGLDNGLDGRYVLALGVAALLAAGTAVTTGQVNRQIRQICAGALFGLGAIGLILVIHEWVTISDGVRDFNRVASTVGSSLHGSLPATAPGTTGDAFSTLFQGLHVSRGWGLGLSGFASSVTGLAGMYLFLVK